jgi:histone acetyltransferase (RNA polymerase elongator complex component)
MKKFNVTIVELGAQSMDDSVLSHSQRGHTSEDTKRAVYDLKRHGFKVGLQLMPGLPGDSGDIFNKSITEVIALHPDMVRLYPVVVIRGTDLARMYGHGMYRPLKLKEAIEICVNSCIRLEGNGLPVIRVGLMSSPTLLEGGQILAGPWHPAFGFLVRSEIYRKSIERYLSELGTISTLRIRAPSKEISLLRGYKNRGILSIKKSTGATVVEIEPDDSVADGVIEVDTP